MDTAVIAKTLSSYAQVMEGESLARHTTMRLGGPARWFVRVSERSLLPNLLSWLERESLPWTILAGGSNTVAPDEGFAGVVIVPGFSSMEIGEDGYVIAEAGAITALFARKVTEAGYGGWEWGVGLPGTIGGAVVGNAGCYGGETRDRLEWVEVWKKADGMVHRFSLSEMQFGYRDSRCKHEALVVLRAAWKLERVQDQEASQFKMKEILQKRKMDQPLGTASAGCLFKNVQTDQATIERIEQQFEPIPPTSRERGIIPAGWLIERAGLKGFACGGMSVSDRHANFAIQQAKATSADLMQLQRGIQRRVREMTGIELETEVRFLG